MKLKTPLIIINFKAYPQGTGRNALHLAKIVDKVAWSTSTNMAISVEPTDIRSIAQCVEIPVLAQHVDNIQPGAHTGHILPEAVKEAGASATLLNHSEHRLDIKTIAATIKRVKNILKTVVCTPNLQITEKVAKLNPDFIAIEPPELIGGNISVSQANPNLIKNAVKRAKGPLLCGAGINSCQDITTAIKLGAKGVLIASHVVKAKNPEKTLNDMVKCLL